MKKIEKLNNLNSQGNEEDIYLSKLNEKARFKFLSRNMKYNLPRVQKIYINLG